MTTEEKFNAAVNVIRSLPKNGPYQPSYDLMLRFYAYFKQATQGPCTGKRPPFYDIPGRAKYGAWKNLGNMSKATAMAKYVEELHTIVETMSYSDNVANFLEVPTEQLESFNLQDLELIAGDVIKRVRSQPNSPIGSRGNSPVPFSGESSPSRHVEDSDHSDDEYIDTIDFADIKKPASAVPNGSIYAEQLPNGLVSRDHVSWTRSKNQSSVDISQEVSLTVQCLRKDIEKLSSRISSLECSSNKSVVAVRKTRGMSLQLIAFIVVWPFLANFIMNRYIFKRK